MADNGETDISEDVLPEPPRLDKNLETEEGAVGTIYHRTEQSFPCLSDEPMMEELKGDSFLGVNSPGSSSVQSELSFPHDNWSFNKVIIKISKCLSKEDLDYMKEMYKDEIGRRVLSNITSPMQLFDEMRKRNFLSPVNLLQLEGLLWTLGRKDVLQLVIDYAHETKNIVYMHPATDEPVNGYKHVKFHVSGKDFTKMTFKDLWYIRAVVASTLAMPEKFVLIDGVDPSESVTVTLLLPNVYATVLQTLLDQDNTDIKMLVHVDIDRITIGDRVYEITDLDLAHESDSSEVIQRQLNLFQKYDESKKIVASLEEENAKLKTDVMILKGNNDLLIGCEIPPELAKKRENVSENVGITEVSSDKKDIGKALDDFSETLKQISEAGFDKQLVLKLLQAHVSIISTRCYHELASVLGYHNQQIQEFVSGIVMHKAIFEVKRYIGDVADSVPAEIKALIEISKMLRPMEKEQLVRDYELTKDDRTVIEDGSVPFLMVLLHKEAQRGDSVVNLIDFLRKCMTKIGRSDLLFQFHIERTKYENEEKSMTANRGKSQKSHKEAEVLHERQDREQMLDDMAKNMKLLTKDMERVKSAILDLPKKSQFENVANMKSEYLNLLYKLPFIKSMNQTMKSNELKSIK